MTSKIKKCQVCRQYTLKQVHCEKETNPAGYKFVKVNLKKDSNPSLIV